MTARVALMELLAIGADPITLAATLSVEPEPTGNQIIKGIRDEVRYAQLSDVQILCSSEKNAKVSQTGIGITAVGLVSPSKVKIGQCKPEDEIIAVGEPHVGQEVLVGEKNRRVADTLDVCRIRKKSFVHEIIPVGSRGILYEARAMAKGSRLSFRGLGSRQINLKKSAGPATVLLCAIRKGSFTNVQESLVGKPARMIGRLRKI
jgi:hypothetical protein